MLLVLVLLPIFLLFFLVVFSALFGGGRRRDPKYKVNFKYFHSRAYISSCKSEWKPSHAETTTTAKKGRSKNASRLLFNSYGNPFVSQFPDDSISTKQFQMTSEQGTWTWIETQRKEKKCVATEKYLIVDAIVVVVVASIVDSFSSWVENKISVSPFEKRKQQQQFKLKNYTRHWLMLREPCINLSIFSLQIVAALKKEIDKRQKSVRIRYTHKTLFRSFIFPLLCKL